MKKLIFSIIPLLVLSACGATEPEAPTPPSPTPDVEEQVAMSFGVTTNGGEVATRSVGELQNLYKRFAVWSWKQKGGSAEDVMCHNDFTPYETIRESGEWHYDIATTVGSNNYTQYLKYWDLSASQYDFVAFTPFRIPDTDDGATTQGAVVFDHDTHLFSISGLRGNISVDTEGSVPWLRAHTRRDMDETAPKDYDMMESKTEPISDNTLTRTSKVPLRFHYLQPVVEIRAYTTCGDDIIASDITFDLSNSAGTEARTVRTLADYSIGPEAVTPSWTFSTDPANTASNLLDIHTNTVIKNLNPEDIPDRRTKSTLLAELYELPEDISEYFANIKVVTIKPSEHKGILPMDAGWESDKQYIYYIIINPDEEYIVMDVDVTVIPWVKGEDIDAGDPLDNW